MRLHIDFETRSEIDLLSRGAYIYSKHPSTIILCAAYSIREDGEEFDPGNVRTWRPWEGEPMPRDLRAGLLDHGHLIEAWNAQFERLIILEHFKRELADADTKSMKKLAEGNLKMVSIIERYHCTAARARACALPGKLELAARFLHTPIQKNMAGNRLMKKWCAPLPEGTYADDPGEYDRLVAYCVDDVNSEGYIGSVIRDLTPIEWQDYAVNERLNDRGIPVDVELAKAAQHYAEAEAAVIRKELSRVTCGEVQTPKQYQKLKDWVIPRVNEYVRQLMTVEDDKTGEKRLSLDKHVRTSILDDPDVSLAVSDDVLTVLELVDDAGRSSTAKFKAIENRADADGRLRGCYILNGAGQTGRKSAHGFQPHNLPVRETIENSADVVELVLAKAPVEQVTLKSGKNILTTLACLLRPTIVAEEKKILVWRDYSAVEARALPWLAMDPSAQDLLDRFARGEDVYLQDASDIYGIPIAEVGSKSTERQGSKVARLSLQFMGGKGALMRMGRNYGLTFDEATAEYIKRAFRRANPWVERFGKKLHRAACLAVLSPGTPYEAGRIIYLMNGADLWCLLPCGRIICYPEARVTVTEGRWGPERTLTASKGSWRPAEGQKTWPRHTMHYTICLENVAQAFCASLLRGALRLLDEAGWPAVMDTHDEIMLEVYEDEADEADKALSDAMLAGMYPGLPLATEASRAFVYGKQ